MSGCECQANRAALALLAALAALPSCTMPAPSAADGLPTFGWAPPRMRAPSSERPAWLPSPPTEPQRLPAPRDGFRA